MRAVYKADICQQEVSYSNQIVNEQLKQLSYLQNLGRGEKVEWDEEQECGSRMLRMFQIMFVKTIEESM